MVDTSQFWRLAWYQDFFEDVKKNGLSAMKKYENDERTNMDSDVDIDPGMG